MLSSHSVRHTVDRFGFGLALPARLVSAAFRQPDLRATYARTVFLQCCATLFLFVSVGTMLGEFADLAEAFRDRDAHEMKESFGTLLLVLYGSQWFVLALSRQFTDRITREVSLLTALPPEDPERKPTLGLEWPWIKKRIWRRIRAAMLYVFGLPVLFLFTLPLAIAFVKGAGLEKIVYGALTAAWAAYWAVVGLTMKTAYAWTEQPEMFQREPWYMRLLQRPEKLWVFAGYVRLFRKRSREIYPPALSFEKAPAPLLGLAAARAVTALPLISIFMRPLLPVAVAKILQAEGVPLVLPPPY